MADADTDSSSDCPLCCSPLSIADRLYPLHCPTAACHFQFCADCLQKLRRSASDGYAEASDGSRQVKVALRCPMCRGAYRNVTDEFISAAVIVGAALKLRCAATIPLPGGGGGSSTAAAPHHCPDSQLSATALSARNVFLQDTSWKELQDAASILQHYHDSIDGKDCGTVPHLDWDAWRVFLERHQQASSSSSSSPRHHGESVGDGLDVLSRDPTLFLGLEDMLTTDEQEFITSMLVSGEAETVAQAAHLLHSIVDMAASRQAAATVRQLSNFTASAAQVEHQVKVRKRFPLLPNMPQAVTLPVFNPLDKNPPLNFVKKDAKVAAHAAPVSELTLAGVRGPAGKVGLRRGDVVTHVAGERVSTMMEFIVAMQLMQHQPLEEPQQQQQQYKSVQVTVNANEDAARRLKERAQEMKKQGIRFH